MDAKKYNTIMFIEKEKDIGKYICGYQLNKYNYQNAPNGMIRIARFKNNFDINNQKSESYYGDIHLKLFIKKWKKVYITNKKRNIEKKLAQLVLHRNKKIPNDIITNISNML
jgi:hypothetical protein